MLTCEKLDLDLDTTPLGPRETPVCPLLNMRVSKKFFEEATEQWFRQRIVECKEVNVFDSICKASPLLRRCLSRVSCTWHSCNFVSGRMAEDFSDFAQVRRCRNIRTIKVEVKEGVFEGFNRLACVDTFTEQDFKTIQEARDLLNLPRLKKIDLTPSECILGITDEEKAKWIENVGALNAYMQAKLKKYKLQREQRKARDEVKEKAKELERARRKAEKQTIRHRSKGAKKKTKAQIQDTRPTGMFVRARNFPRDRGATSSKTPRSSPVHSAPRTRKHPALRPRTLKSPPRVIDGKTSQDTIVKRAMTKRKTKQPFPLWIGSMIWRTLMLDSKRWFENVHRRRRDS